MLFKLSLQNMKKSFKDYAIYFMTLVLGVSIFYMFNSLDSQKAMLDVSESTHEIIDLMITVLSGVSVFVSIVLGFLIVYANNFLIKRRKKEFGIYMTLGMKKGSISKILVLETLIIGIISLGIGLIIGVFGSQLMSILIARMFQANMNAFRFVFSGAACVKTIIYFGIMYVLVIIFNTFTISRYKLIDLITAIKKNETFKIKNTFICVSVFITSILLLAYAYYNVTANSSELTSTRLMIMIVVGSIATFLFFWSLSGFLLKLVQSSKRVYLKNLNMFVLRQTNSKINTTVISMTLICLMLFITICVLSSAISLNNSLQSVLTELAPADITIYKNLNVSGKDIFGEPYTEARIEDSKRSVSETLEAVDFEMNVLIDIVEIVYYGVGDLTLTETLGTTIDEVTAQYPFMITSGREDIIKVSDYNKIARLYENEEYSLKDNEYIMLCNYESMKIIRDAALQEDTRLTINGKEYSPKYKECQDGFIEMSNNYDNFGIILVPDSCDLAGMETKCFFAANYNAGTNAEKQEIEKELSGNTLIEALTRVDSNITTITKIFLFERSVGVGALVTFIALYLGIIFLISSAAILALKELTESSDNKERYSLLRKIGTDEKMINKALFLQIGIFFIIPLALAGVHSIFGIRFAIILLSTTELMTRSNLTGPIIVTALIIILIYGGYFLATYLGSKNIIKED